VLDEGGVLGGVGNDLPPDRVRERDVGADVETEPQVGPLRGGGPPRVDRVELRAASDPLQDVVEEDGVRLARVRPPQDDEIGLLDLLIGTGTASGTEHRRQTDDAWSVSGAVTAVDVVAAEGLTHELLCDEVHLVRGLRAAEHADAVLTVPIVRGAESLR